MKRALTVLVLLVACSVGTPPAGAQDAPTVTKVEPPSGWTGSTLDPVRLLVRGTHLHGARVEAPEGSGLEVGLVRVNARGTYLFVDVGIDGWGANVVPDRCEVTLDRRLVLDESIDEVAAQLTELGQQSCPLPLEVERLGQLNVFWQPPDSPWIRQLAEWSGQAPVTAPYGTNAWAWSMEPGPSTAHAPGRSP